MNPGSVAAVRKAIPALLSEGHPTIGRVALAVGAKARTLQRRLHDAGVSHTQLVDECRRETAYLLLANHDYRISDVATALGYADQSSFSRAFMRWTGMSPRAFRYSLRREAENCHRRPR